MKLGPASPSKHTSSKHSHLRLTGETNKDLRHSKGSTITNKLSGDTTTKSRIFHSFATILEGSSKSKSGSEQKHNDSESSSVSSKDKHTLVHSHQRCKETSTISSIKKSPQREMNYFQPNYLPSSGKNIPNNIPKTGVSSNGVYKDKLEQQTVISQQVCFHKHWLFPVRVPCEFFAIAVSKFIFNPFFVFVG